MSKAKIITLCGSTKFRNQFEEQNRILTLQGNIVISVAFFIHKGDIITEEQKIFLDKMHKRKIDISDEIFVLNVGGYIGSSTRSEIEYAKKTDKLISYLESIPKQKIYSKEDRDELIAYHFDRMQ